MTKTNRYIKCMLLSLAAVLASLAVMMTCTTQVEAKTNWKKTVQGLYRKERMVSRVGW